MFSRKVRMEKHSIVQDFLTAKEKQQLYSIAALSIRHGLEEGTVPKTKGEDLQGVLGENGAAFVTLRKQTKLRGCVGSLEANRPLAIDVLENAYAAAFEDARFPSLRLEEWNDLDIKISVLSRAEPIEFHSEKDLIAQLHPGIDGLILTEGCQRGTFLPSVWSDLSNPDTFLEHLKKKAKLPADYWSDTIRVERYRTIEFGAETEH